MNRIKWGVTGIILALCMQSSQANLPVTGYLLAEKACPALHSIKKQTNPGGVLLVPGQTYTVTAINKAAATHYLIDLEQPERQQRWVALDCGRFLDNRSTAPLPPPQPAHPQNDYLLAVSWQPAFCQSHQEKPECSSQTAARYDATHLALHGLWPQPKDNAYCGIDSTLKAIDRRNAWHLLPRLDISPALRRELDMFMPGTQSNLQRHEWYKHGSCYGTPENYYRDSVTLMQALNTSAVNRLLAEHIGRNLDSEQIRAAFEQAFGEGAGSKVNVRCEQKRIVELWINLRGNLSEQPFSTLIRQAPAAGPEDCAGGLVDPAGF